MVYKTYTYRVYPNTGGLWKSAPWQRGDGRGGLWKSRPFQRGDGWGSFFGRMAKKILPVAGKFASKSFKTLKNSKTLKEVGNALLDRGMTGITEIAANAIEGTKDNKSTTETAQERLGTLFYFFFLLTVKNFSLIKFFCQIIFSYFHQMTPDVILLISFARAETEIVALMKTQTIL